MDRNAPAIDAMLDSWREQDAERIAPLRFHTLASLQRRLSAHEGEARRLLEHKLAALLEAHAPQIDAAIARDADAQTRFADARSREPLTDLLAQFARHADVQAGYASANDSPGPPRLPDIGTLDDARRLWSGLRARSQLQHSLEQTVDDAGPLNSSRLVHRMLSRMRELSPGYLQQMLSYVDALSWLERLHDDGVLGDGATTTPQANPMRKRARPRKRKT